jgi:hypothetical protein
VIGSGSCTCWTPQRKLSLSPAAGSESIWSRTECSRALIKEVEIIGEAATRISQELVEAAPSDPLGESGGHAQ